MRKFIENFKINHRITLSYLSFFFAMGFAIAGISLPPVGQIFSSVLILIAQLLVLSATFLGLNVKFDLQNKYFHAHQPGSTTKEDLAKIKQAVDDQYPAEEEKA